MNSFFNIDDTPGPRGRLNFYGVMDFCKDNDGNIWIGTHKWIGISKIPGPGYLLKYDVAKDTIYHYPSENENLGIVQAGVNSMIFDPNRNMIWSGSDNGLTGFDIGLNNYLTDNDFLNVESTLKGTVINDLYLDENDLLWIATFGEGLYVMDINTYQLKKIDESEGLTESSFYALTEDNFGNIWTSVSAYLIKIKRPKNHKDTIRRIERYGIQEGFPPQQYFRAATCKGADGTLYFGGDDGYIAFNPEQVKNIVL